MSHMQEHVSLKTVYVQVDVQVEVRVVEREKEFAPKHALCDRNHLDTGLRVVVVGDASPAGGACAPSNPFGVKVAGTDAPTQSS